MTESIEDIAKQFKDGKITKEQLQNLIMKQDVQAPADVKENAPASAIAIESDITEARELLRGIKERSEKMKKL